jgi:hypothetical protein
MNLREINNALEHRISGGADYQWSCWDNARFLDYESEYGYASVVFNTITQEVYEASVEQRKPEAPVYRWTDPKHETARNAEAERKGIKDSVAFDDTEYTDLETDQDFLIKAAAIFKGEEFDRRIEVPIHLTDAEFWQLAVMAHERDITFNEMVSVILREVIERAEDEKNCYGDSDECCGHCDSSTASAGTSGAEAW